MRNQRGISFLLLLGLQLSLLGCGGASEHQDLKDYIEETKRRPAGQIEALPALVRYKAFSYASMTLRSPFTPPIEVVERAVLGLSTNVKPNELREKEFLEDFNLASLSMVGSLQLSGVRWVLINDGQGGVHKVTEGNYLGKNNGRIVVATERKLDLIEIVPNGTDGWVERPQLLQIIEKE